MKFVIASLVGASSAALSPLPMDSANFPVYSTLDVASGTDLTDPQIKESYIQHTISGSTVSCGPARGYRNGYYVLPLQKVASSTGTKSKTTRALTMTMGTGFRSFWTHDVAKIGAYIPPNTGGSTLADVETQSLSALDGTNDKFVICATIDTAVKCNGVAYNTLAEDTTDEYLAQKNQWPTLRTVVKANTEVVTDDEAALYTYQFNEDIGLASFYQSSLQTGTLLTDGTQWCSAFQNTLAADGTKADMTVTLGWNSKTKCNFMMTAADATVAPTFSVKTLTDTKIILQWVEWNKVTDLGTNGVMQAADDATGFFQGAYTYTALTAGPYLNPFITVGTGRGSNSLGAFTEWGYYKAPQNWAAGSVGELRYHNANAGLLDDYNTSTGDIAIFWDMQAQKKAEYDSYNTLKDEFEVLKADYETKKAERQAQLDDFLSTGDAVVVPDRPEEPTMPKTYAGPTPDLSKYTTGSKTWKALASENDGNAGLVTDFANFDSIPTISGVSATGIFANKLGYLMATTDDSVTTVEKTGHVFGVLGQGDITMPDTNTPFLFASQDSATASIMLGVYPSNSDQTGITDATAQIVLEASANKWTENIYINQVPDAPTATSGIAQQLGAQAVAVSGALVALVASSLL